MSTPAEREFFLNNANTLEFVKLILQVWLHKKIDILVLSREFDRAFNVVAALILGCTQIGRASCRERV